MRVSGLLVALALLAVPAAAQDADRSVEGGVQVEGWMNRIDRRPLEQGMTADDSRMTMEGDAFRLSVGPAGNFWNPEHVASGDYEVSATFFEHATNSSHPHPYGLFIGGADLESDTEELLYCIVYGNGDYAVKTFHGENVTAITAREASDAINVANADGEATNEVAWRVSGGTASCVVNGQVVGTYSADDVIGDDKISSFDGVYGIRVSHNVELTVSDYGMEGM